MKANTTSMEMVAAFVEKGLFFKTKRVTERDRKLLASLSTSCTAITGRFTAALPAKQQPDRSMKPTLRLHRRI